MKKNKISKNWIIQQHRDQYFKQAKSSGFRSRSAYKLLELNKKFRIFKNCKTVIDLGCYPGGWSQILRKYLNLEVGMQGNESPSKVKDLIDRFHHLCFSLSACLKRFHLAELSRNFKLLRIKE